MPSKGKKRSNNKFNRVIGLKSGNTSSPRLLSKCQRGLLIQAVHSRDHFFYECAWIDPWTSSESSTLYHLNWGNMKIFLCLRLCIWQVQRQVPRHCVSSALLALLLPSGCTFPNIACVSLPRLVLKLNPCGFLITWFTAIIQDASK